MLETIVQWFFYILMGFLGLFALGLGYELLYKVWHQVVLGEFRVEGDQGALAFCRVANQVLDRKGKPPVDVGTWLKRAEYESVSRELKRRYAERKAMEPAARRLTGEERARIIRLQIEGCLAELIDRRTNRYRLILEEGSLRIESEQAVERGVEIAFSARAWRESERLAPDDEAPIPVSGKIVLDAALRTAPGPNGGTALTPVSTCIEPGEWTDGAWQALGGRRDEGGGRRDEG